MRIWRGPATVTGELRGNKPLPGLSAEVQRHSGETGGKAPKALIREPGDLPGG